MTEDRALWSMSEFSEQIKEKKYNGEERCVNFLQYLVY